MTSQRDLHQFLVLNPDFGPTRRDPQTGVREHEVLRSQGSRVLFALLDETTATPPRPA